MRIKDNFLLRIKRGKNLEKLSNGRNGLYGTGSVHDLIVNRTESVYSIGCMLENVW